MLQLCCCSDLGEEPFAAKCGAQVRVETFDRDVPVVPHVVREIDSGHAALSELALDVVSSLQCFGKAADGVGHIPGRVIGRG